ncbi:hypothetical protein D3C72_643420 [compost metagenome]
MPRPKPPQRDVLTIEERGDRSPFLINGEPLADLIDRVLARSPEAYRAWHKAGGFLPMAMGHSDRYFTEDEARGLIGLEVPLFKCNCGESGCASVDVHIVIGAETVIWRSFSISQLKGPAPGLGPFVFDRRPYEAALGIERGKAGLQQTAWHLGTTDEDEAQSSLLMALVTLVRAIATGEQPLPDGRKVRRSMPLATDLEAFDLNPRDVYNFETDEVGTLSFSWWDELGPEDWRVTATIFYSPVGPRLVLATVDLIDATAPL